MHPILLSITRLFHPFLSTQPSRKRQCFLVRSRSTRASTQQKTPYVTPAQKSAHPHTLGSVSPYHRGMQSQKHSKASGGSERHVDATSSLHGLCNGYTTHPLMPLFFFSFFFLALPSCNYGREYKTFHEISSRRLD